MPLEAHLLLAERNALAGGNAKLPGDEILAGDRLGDRVLDLQAGVHLEEVERPVGGQQELHGPGAAIADGTRGSDRGGTHAGAQIGVHSRRGCFLDHLLVAPLHRTVALPEVEDSAVRIGKHLDFDVPGIDHGLLENELARSEGALGLGAGRPDRLDEFVVAMDQPHAAASAAGRGLDHHRQADLARLVLEVGIALVCALVAGHAGNAGVDHAPLGGGLVTHGRDGRGRRADEDQAGLFAGGREGVILRQEAVARVDRVGAALTCGLQDAVDAEIALAHRRRPDAYRLVGEGDVRGFPVGIRKDGDGAIAHRLGRAHDAPGDLAAIGDQDLAESHHAPAFIRRPSAAAASRRRRAGLPRLRGRAAPRRTCRRRSRAPATAARCPPSSPPAW